MHVAPGAVFDPRKLFLAAVLQDLLHILFGDSSEVACACVHVGYVCARL